MTYTHPYTHRFHVYPYTLPVNLHAHPRIERETTYTGTYTAYTGRDLHVRPPLLTGGGRSPQAQAVNRNHFRRTT